MVHKTVPEIDHEIAHKIEPEIPLEIVYLIVSEKVPNMLEYTEAVARTKAAMIEQPENWTEVAQIRDQRIQRKRRLAKE